MSLDCEWIVLHRPLYLGRQQVFRTGEETRATLPMDALDRSSYEFGSSAGRTHAAPGVVLLVQSSLLSHLMWCMIIQQMEATANYLLLLKNKQKQNNTFAVLLRLCGFSTFFCCCCCFCLSGLKSTFPKWCTLLRMPLLCGGTLNSMHGSCVFNKNKQKKKTKPLNAWFGIPFLKGYSVFKTTPPLQSTKTCSVNKACC